ncbi:TssQ family T6SS-associated lipoprotein [Caldimonas sp. KR1-144]
MMPIITLPSPLGRLALSVALLALVSACAPMPPQGAAPAAAAPAPAPLACPAPQAATPACPTPEPVSVVELSSRPAERALIGGLRAYDDAQYRVAEQRLAEALKLGLAAPADRAAAHKTLAFVYCTSRRLKQCEAAFRAAREADPQFALNKAEAGHPLWGPVYKKVVAGP